jgi:hypothetical protein
VVKRWVPKAAAAPTTTSSRSPPQRPCCLPGTTLLRCNNHQAINFVGCPKQGSQVPDVYFDPRALTQSHRSRSGAGFACLTNLVRQAWVCLLGSLFRAIPKAGRGRRQSQEGVGGQGGREGRGRRRACTTTEVEEGHTHDLDNGLTKALPEVYGPQVLSSTCDRNFGGEHEELEHLEARSVVISFLVSLFSPTPCVLFVVVGFE